MTTTQKSPLPSVPRLSLTLNAHLPWVIHHGTWPHGLEWLLEAAADSLLPLLGVLDRLHADHVPFAFNFSFSPVLLEQLSHPIFRREFPLYLQRKIDAAREDESFFATTNAPEYIALAHHWQQHFAALLAQFHAIDGNITAAFARYYHLGFIEILATAGTHAYLPLLSTDQSIRAQVHLGLTSCEKHFRHSPRGFWLPECGYRPGIGALLAENSIGFFFADAHLFSSAHTLYHPHRLDEGSAAITVFPRDPRTATQLWSPTHGYLADEHYLDFHARRWPGGHRYWLTAPDDSTSRRPYNLAAAADRAITHADHFASLCTEILAASQIDTPAILSAPFDADLFGHWWFEGPQWLEHLARRLATSPSLQLSTAGSYLSQHPAQHISALTEGSWGAHGDHHVWQNPETAFTWQQIHPAESALTDLLEHEAAAFNAAVPAQQTLSRIESQLCRELLLMQSSDWQSLITTAAARDYAEARFNFHATAFRDLHDLLDHPATLSEEELHRLAELESRDDLFPALSPALWR